MKRLFLVVVLIANMLKLQVFAKQKGILSEIPPGKEISKRIESAISQKISKLSPDVREKEKEKIITDVQNFLKSYQQLTRDSSQLEEEQIFKKTKNDQTLEQLLGTVIVTPQEKTEKTVTESSQSESISASTSNSKSRKKKRRRSKKAKKIEDETLDDEDEDEDEDATTSTKDLESSSSTKQDSKEDAIDSETMEQNESTSETLTKKAILESLPKIRQDLREKMISKNEPNGKCTVERFIWYVKEFIQRIPEDSELANRLETLNSVIQEAKKAESTNDVIACCRSMKKLFKKELHVKIKFTPKADYKDCEIIKSKDIQSICDKLQDKTTNSDAFAESAEIFNNKVNAICQKQEDSPLQREFQMKHLLKLLKMREKAIEQRKILKNIEAEEGCADAGSGNELACSLKESLKKLREQIAKAKKDIENTELTNPLTKNLEDLELEIYALTSKEDSKSFETKLEALKSKIQDFDVKSEDKKRGGKEENFDTE